MPELPELEAFKYIIQSHCLKKNITTIKSFDAHLIQKISFARFKKKLIHHSFSAVARRGKYLIIKISSSNLFLIMHFGLTGFLVYSKDPQEHIKFTQVKFIFDDNSVLHWISVRKFAKLWLISSIDAIKSLKNLGQDPLKISKTTFLSLLEKYKTKNIKAFLMDQSILAGIGNEYSDEILFQAGIDPHHKIKDLSKTEFLNIYSHMQKILKFASKLRIKDIKKWPEENFFTNKDRATFPSSYLQAHRHTDMHCPKNKSHLLKKVTIAGRSTYYCPKDQH